MKPVKQKIDNNIDLLSLELRKFVLNDDASVILLLILHKIEDGSNINGYRKFRMIAAGTLFLPISDT